jgi:ABC-2 type transport system permease protein
MTRILAIACREVGAFYRLPLGWVVTALYLLLAGGVFTLSVMQPAAPATMRPFFGISGWMLLFVAPAISMRLISEEHRAGSMDGLLSAPITDWQVVIGKYLGAAGFLCAMVAPTLVYVLVLEAVSNPDYGPIVTGYLGMALVGMLYLAVGLLASSLTNNQTVAFLATLFFLLIARLATTQGPAYLGEPFARWLFAMSIDLRESGFARGVIDTGDVTFFIAATVWFVVLTVTVVESRRWR